MHRRGRTWGHPIRGQWQGGADRSVVLGLASGFRHTQLASGSVAVALLTPCLAAWGCCRCCTSPSGILTVARGHQAGRRVPSINAAATSQGSRVLRQLVSGSGVCLQR